MGKQWTELNSIEKREERFKRWLSPPSVHFSTLEAERLYKVRTSRLINAIQLKESDRVPVEIAAGPFMAHYAGINLRTAMYNYDETRRAFLKFFRDFDVDAFDCSGFSFPGRVYEALGYKTYRWPGHGLDSNASMVQFVEAEYMKSDEYDIFIKNPADYMLRKFLPRNWSLFEPFQTLMPFSPLFNLPQWLLSFASRPDTRNVLNTLASAGEEFFIWRQTVEMCIQAGMEIGFPPFEGGMSVAPFDFFADSLRGTRGITMDMFRQPDKLLESLEIITPMIIDMAVLSAQHSISPLILMPLHKGEDSFMSRKQFETFYWPTLRKVLMGLINEGLIPAPIADGRYDDRLEIIKDITPASMIWTFEKTDMFKAKRVLGSTACISGNVLASQIYVSTPHEVKEYCRKLIEFCGKGGGYILTLGASVDKGNPENMQALVATANEYGKRPITKT